jgi:hypothetical protein
MDAVFHVTCVYVEKPLEEKKRKVTVQDKSKLTEAILTLFNIPRNRDYILQLYDEEFSDWVDLDDTGSIPDKGKLKITICSGSLHFISADSNLLFLLQISTYDL